VFSFSSCVACLSAVIRRGGGKESEVGVQFPQQFHRPTTTKITW